MATWEFLLQQEGDGEWLPLESPVVEILEGRYRLVACSRYSNTPIWVDVVFRDESYEFSPFETIHSYVEQTERMQAWESQTNAEGLLLLMPFSYLKPGQWEFKCQVDTDCPPSDTVSQVQSSQICLQVLATESNVKDPWSHLDLFSTGEKLKDSAVSMAESIPALAVKPSSTTIAPVPTPSFVKSPVETPASPSITPVSATAGLTNPIPVAAQIPSDATLAHPRDFRYYFNIVQEHLAVHRRGESVWLLGEIQVEAATGSAIAELPFPVVLQVILRDPTTQQPIQEFLHPIGHDLIPIPFACELPIPETYQPHLLLGELTLCQANSVQDEMIQAGNIQAGNIQAGNIAIASQPFSVATNLDTVFTEPRNTGETVMTRLFHATELQPVKAAIQLNSVIPAQPAAFPIFSALQHSGWEDFISLTNQDTIPVSPEPIDAFAGDDLDTLEDGFLLENAPFVVDPLPSFRIQPQGAACEIPPVPAVRSGQLCLDLFNLVKNPSHLASAAVESYVAQMGWENPPQLRHPDSEPAAAVSEPLPESTPQDPMTRTSQFPDLPLNRSQRQPVAAAWTGTLHAPVFDGYNSVRELSQRPVSSAQVLTRLIHATQTETPDPTLNAHGGQAAVQNRFHTKLADLLSVKPRQTP